jgi:phosphoribosyl 1,2-cyclic phosphodiesterase
MEKLRFMSLSSGSSGNCYYIGTETYGFLVDAGIAVGKIKKLLREHGVAFEDVLGVAVTHDHADHVKSVGVLGEVEHLPIYSTSAVHEGISNNRYVREPLTQAKRIIEKETPFAIGDFRITAFDVPHDSVDNVGYAIEYGSRTFVFLTDVGHITETITAYARRANYLVLEANYDTEMLAGGSYPEFLKQRVSGEKGHLSNREAADFLAANYTERLSHVWLCHLSRDNNHPELAVKTVEYRLKQEGVNVGKDLQLAALKRFSPSEMFEFEA